MAQSEPAVLLGADATTALDSAARGAAPGGVQAPAPSSHEERLASGCSPKRPDHREARETGESGESGVLTNANDPLLAVRESRRRACVAPLEMLLRVDDMRSFVLRRFCALPRQDSSLSIASLAVLSISIFFAPIPIAVILIEIVRNVSAYHGDAIGP